MNSSISTPDTSDTDLIKVSKWLSANARPEKIGLALRRAIDWVIDGARTQRYDLKQVEQSEKLYLGNRVEHEIIHELNLVKKPQGIDTTICDIPVDIKFSIGSSWMIPPEGINYICMLISANDYKSQFSLGIFRAYEEYLNKPNRDMKRSISKTNGMPNIHWLLNNAPFPDNFLLNLNPEIRKEILSQKSGQARVTQAFRLVLEKPISAVTLDTLAVQRDPSKRARDARKQLISEGIQVLCGRWKSDLEELEKLNLPTLQQDQWLSTRRKSSLPPLHQND